MSKPEQEQRFEAALTELEGIVARLESGELSLEESIAAFEQGVTLVRRLHERLNEIERRVEILVSDQQGDLRVQPFDEGTKKPG